MNPRTGEPPPDLVRGEPRAQIWPRRGFLPNIYQGLSTCSRENQGRRLAASRAFTNASSTRAGWTSRARAKARTTSEPGALT